jgi:Ca2+-binding RTX toxin-like protein
VATDKVTELAGGGTADTVETALATYSLAALLQVENLTFTGVGGFTGTGNALANTITGGIDGDNLNGGLGNDTLIGGAGADSFIFNSSIAAANVDTIDDFTLGEDIIKLENAIFTAVGVAGALSGLAFASNTDGLADDATDRIIYNSTNGWLNYDSNGSTAGGVIVHFATIDTGLSLTAADFLII